MINKFDSFNKVDFFLKSVGVDDDLSDLVFAIARAGKYVSHSVMHGETGYSDSNNNFGENQLKLDIISDDIFCSHLKSTELVSVFASEEQENLVKVSNNGRFAVAFDPLDGSSIVNANFSVGSIFGIYEGDQFLGKKGKDLLCSGYIIYGPITKLVVATHNGVYEFVENFIGEFVYKKEFKKLADSAKYFAPGNIRAAKENNNYKKLINKFMDDQLTLRYSGGMAPDIHMIFTKESGFFCHLSDSKYKNGKLRLLYECASFAFINDILGGLAVDENGENILEKEITHLHQTTSIIIGSKFTVEDSLRILNS